MTEKNVVEIQTDRDTYFINLLEGRIPKNTRIINFWGDYKIQQRTKNKIFNKWKTIFYMSLWLEDYFQISFPKNTSKQLYETVVNTYLEVYPEHKVYVEIEYPEQVEDYLIDDNIMSGGI